MTETECREEAMRVMVIYLPASWIQNHRTDDMTPRAVRLRDSIAKALRAAYDRGRKETKTDG